MGTLFTARGEKFLSEFNLGEKEAATKMFFLEKKKIPYHLAFHTLQNSFV